MGWDLKAWKKKWRQTETGRLSYERDKKRRRELYHTPKHKSLRLRKRYGISLEAFNAILESQKHQCLICLVSLAQDIYTCVDHCHSTGEVRGILCRNCNSAIGLLKDDPKIIARAVKYLRGQFAAE